MKISGIIPPMVTPFAEDESLDEGLLAAEVRRMLDAGVHGLSFAGSTGEGVVLSDDELYRGISVVQQENKGRVPVLCGVMRNSRRDAVSGAKAAKAGGADVLMVTPTFYFGAEPAGNAAYYQEIYDATGLPIVIYNVIKINPILPEHVPLLAENPGIIGIKQSVGGIHALADMLPACEGRLSVFGAQDDVMFLSYLLGAHGSISAILSLFPRLCVEEWDAVCAGDVSRARSIHRRILPVWRAIEGQTFPARLKAALSLLGINAGIARSPLKTPGAQETERIRQALVHSGFLQK